jgi:hypothetical protein
MNYKVQGFETGSNQDFQDQQQFQQNNPGPATPAETSKPANRKPA